jgi:hypothetical protein
MLGFFILGLLSAIIVYALIELEKLEKESRACDMRLAFIKGKIEGLEQSKEVCDRILAAKEEVHACDIKIAYRKGEIAGIERAQEIMRLIREGEIVYYDV